jgi:hypothetical protein
MGNRAIERPVLENIEEQAREVVEEQTPDLTQLSKKQLLEVLLKATDELTRRTQVAQNDPQQLLLQQLLSNSRGNTQAMVILLQNTAEQLGVEKKYIRVAREDEPGTIRKLLKKTASLFTTAVIAAKEQITFSRVMNTAAIYRFGLTPYLIYGSAMRSGLSILGFAYGTVAIGLTGRFLYLHPDLLKLLSKLQNPSMDLLENIDLFAALAALKSALTSELSYMLKDGFGSLRSDINVFGPFLLSSLDYIGWSASVLDFAINTNVKDISKAFVYWVQQKTELFSYVWQAASYIKEQVQQAKETVTRVTKETLGRGYKAIEAGLQSISDWWFNKAEKAKIEMDGRIEELELMSIERGEVRMPYSPESLSVEEPLQLTGRRR